MQEIEPAFYIWQRGWVGHGEQGRRIGWVVERDDGIAWQVTPGEHRVQIAGEIGARRRERRTGRSFVGGGREQRKRLLEYRGRQAESIQHGAQRAGSQPRRHREAQPRGKFVLGCRESLHCLSILEHGQRAGGRHARIFIIRNHNSAASTRAGSSFAQGLAR